MTDRADDIAFRDLKKEALARGPERRRSCEAEGLRRRITVIEVHLMWFERPGTVGAWNATEIA